MEQITCNGQVTAGAGQRVLYVTERCVFQLTTEGLELIEVAPGIDVERNILPHMAFRPLMRAPGLMDERTFSRDLMGPGGRRLTLEATRCRMRYCAMQKAYLAAGRLCRVTFAVRPADPVNTVSVCGEFNGWDPTVHPLQRRQDGRFSRTLSLTVGQQYRFRYLLDGRHWENDPTADAYVPNPFGSEDSVLRL